MIRRLVLHLLITALSVTAAANLVPGVSLSNGWTGALTVALVLGFLNAFVRPFLALLALPVTLLTLGLFSLVVNGVVFSLAAWLTDSLQVAGLMSAVGASVVVAVCNAVMGWLLGTDSKT